MTDWFAEMAKTAPVRFQDRFAGRCTVCDRRFRIRKNGTVWSHTSTTDRFMNCAGAGKPPVPLSGGPA